ncbi:MAG: response regulator transcription factor [Gemmatimonadota bacterium]
MSSAERDSIRVLIADDHALVREGLRHVLSVTPGFDVVGEAGSGAETLAEASRLAPDVVVLDISMPHGSGLEVAAELRVVLPATRILVLSMHDHEQYVLESVRAGAHGYLRKDSSPAELRDGIRAVARGDTFFTAPVASQLSAAIRGEASRDARTNKLASLTAREKDVLLGVVAGETNKDIAARLRISPRTVESHRENLMRKLEIRSVAGLTRFAVDEGLLASEPARDLRPPSP